MQIPPLWVQLGPAPEGTFYALFERGVLDVVLGGVLVGELVDHVGAVAVRVVDLDEGFPFVRERVLGENRLDGTLRFARAAICCEDPTGKREGVLTGHNRTEGVLSLSVATFDLHDAPV